jgi:hypothetical protein
MQIRDADSVIKHEIDAPGLPGSDMPKRLNTSTPPGAPSNHNAAISACE